MQGVYNYIPETNNFSTVYSVAAVLYLQFVIHVKLFRTWNMFCILKLVFSEVCVQCPISLFFAVPWFRVFPVCCSGIVCELFWDGSSCPSYYRLSLLLSHSTCAEFLL
jgi:hypothetical protein